MGVSQVRVTAKLGKFKYKIPNSTGTGTKTVTGDVYTWVRKEVAEYFGLTIEKNPRGHKDGDGEAPIVRGTKGAGSIRLPRAQKSKNRYRYHNIPVPAYFTIGDMKEFIDKQVKNHKPEFFVSPGGRTYPL